MIQSVKVVVFSACMVLSSFVSHAHAQSVCVEAENPVSGNRSNSNLVSGMEGQYNGCYGNEYEHSVYNVSVSSAGPYTLKLRFSSAEYPYAGIIINGGALQRFNLGHSGSWNTFTDKEFPVTLNAGTNTIRIQGPDGNVGYKGSGACFNLDKFCVTPKVNCASPIDGSAQTAGMYSYDNVSKCLQVCNGTQWVKLGGSQPSLNYCTGGGVAGPVKCWGQNGRGQAPATISGQFKAISAGYYQTCMLNTGGSVNCIGQYGGGGGLASPPTATFSSISAGDYGTCGIKTDGDSHCWSFTGVKTGPFQSVSVNRPGTAGVHACALKANGDAECWVNAVNWYGEAPTTMTGPFTQISSGGRFTCAIRSNGDARCWGDNGQGQNPPNGSGMSTTGTYGGPNEVGGVTGPFTKLSAGGTHVCGILANQNIKCWGNNANGQAPASVTGPFIDVASGQFHTCAVKSNGDAQCWGDSWHYGGNSSVTGPFLSIAAGADHTCAIQQP